MSRKLNEFIKIVAALLAVVAVVGLLGSFISDRKSDEDPSESESVRFEESTEKESTPLEDEVVDHTDCKNEHNWSIYTTNTGSNNHIDNYNYRCGYCNTLFFSYGSIGDPISPGFFYGIADLSTAHKFDHSTGISSHFNHNMGGSYLYISSKASGGKITTSFKTLDVPVGGKYMVISYRSLNDLSGDLTLTLTINGQETSSTIDNPVTNGWKTVIFDISGYNGFITDSGLSTKNSIGVSFSHFASLDIAFIGWSSKTDAAIYSPAYSSPYYDLGTDFSSLGEEIYNE